MMEFELCIGLIFKPLRYHLTNIVECESGGSIPAIWLSILGVLEDVLGDKFSEPPSPLDDSEDFIPEPLKATMNSLANEHLRNAIMILLSTGVLSADDSILAPGDISTKTWESISRMGVSHVDVQQWKGQATSLNNACLEVDTSVN